MPQVQGQKRSPNKMAGEVKSRLQSNPKPTRHSEGSNKTLSARGPRDPTRDWGRSAFECLSVSCGCTGQLWPAMGTGALATADLGGVVCDISPFEGGSHCHHYPIIVWPGQTSRREHSPTHQQKIGLKITEPWPSKQDPDSLTASPSH